MTRNLSVQRPPYVVSLTKQSAEDGALRDLNTAAVLEPSRQACNHLSEPTQQTGVWNYKSSADFVQKVVTQPQQPTQSETQLDAKRHFTYKIVDCHSTNSREKKQNHCYFALNSEKGDKAWFGCWSTIASKAKPLNFGHFQANIMSQQTKTASKQ